MAAVLVVTLVLGAGTVAYVFGYPVLSTIEKTSHAPTWMRESFRLRQGNVVLRGESERLATLSRRV